MFIWAVGSVLNLPNLMNNGLPLLGTFVFGYSALFVALFLDIVGPLVFLYALWNRKHRAAIWATFYIGLFILNGIVALFTVQQDLGLAQILAPNLACLAFLVVVFRKRRYFAGTG